jgi:hypothetical protein
LGEREQHHGGGSDSGDNPRITWKHDRKHARRQLETWALAALLFLVAAGSWRIASTWRVFNHTIDEPDNLAAGMEYLSTGKYRYEDTHPPLARVFAAIGPYLAAERFHPGPAAYQEGYRILGHGAHYDRTLALARAGILPFFWIASVVVFLWARRLGGPAAGVVAALLFTTLPPILAHAGVTTTDAALCAMTGAAGLASLYWAERPTVRRSLVFGALLALACISKFSALVFMPGAWVLMLLASGRAPAWVAREAWERRRSIAIVLATTWMVIWAAYGFSFARVEFLHLRLPAPRLFAGIHAVWVHNHLGHSSYLLGRRSPNGFWYYFPVVLAIKTPLALLVLTALALWRAGWRRLRLPLAFSAGILLVSLTGHIDIGSRFVLAVYIGMTVACGAAIVEMKGLAARAAIAALIGWQVVSGALQHPDYLAYTNEIAGSHPERFVADSDLDWGQDMKRLGAFLERAGATHLTFAPFNRTYAMAGHPLPPMSAGETDHPSPGWNAVSITIWKVFGYPAWADRVPEQQRIGKSILVWYFPETVARGAE